MVAGKGLKLPTLLGIIQEVQNRPNGDVGITQGCRQYRTDDRMDDWEDINAKDASCR